MGLKSKFCAKCGRQTTQLADGICTDCSFSSLEVHVPKTVTLIKCKHCGAVNFEGIWLNAEEPDKFYFENLLIKKVKLPEGADLKEIKVNEVSGNASISATVGFNGKDFVKDFEIGFETKEKTCDSCSARKREHYEAKIQLRTYNKEEFAEMMELAREFKTHILKVEDQPTGADIFMTSKEAARHLAAELRKDFDLKTKESGDAYGWEKFRNRPRYRLVISMRARE